MVEFVIGITAALGCVALGLGLFGLGVPPRTPVREQRVVRRTGLG
jgi:hypothetical protein